MSRFTAIVSEIKQCDSLHIVSFDFHGQTLAMMSLELHEAIAVGTKVLLAAKPSHVALGKKVSGLLSYSNQLDATILSCEHGELLSTITLDYCGTVIESLITRASAERMTLKKGDAITAFIKASELSIQEILDA